MTEIATTAATRERGGVQLPAVGDWTIDPGHAEVAFIGRHLMLTKVRGRSVEVDWPGERAVVHGDLTIHGVTRRIPLEVTFAGAARDPWGDREDFGLTWNMVLDTGGLLVSRDIQR
jgi:polyisoprenoid-binding protein YceI